MSIAYSRIDLASVDAFGRVDWAVCNLNTATLATVAVGLRRVARNLILSGFREDEC